MSLLKVNNKRLWSRIMEIGEIGAIEGTTGCNRQALTKEDKIGRDLFCQWAEEAGCDIRIDNIGNIFARRPGKSNQLPAVITGSHLDTQPTGGKFDGIYGCLAGLEVLQTLTDYSVETMHPLEVVVWTNEEGCRFSTAMMGSAVWSSKMALEEAYALTDSDGLTVEQELEKIGYLGRDQTSAQNVKCAFEAHIEQGPVLENQQKTIGIVTSVQWMSRHLVTINGQEAHAGPTPMRLRKDPVQALSQILPKAYASALSTGAEGRITFGCMDFYPGSNNTVPGKITFTVDIRHPNQGSYDKILNETQCSVKEACDSLGLEFEMLEFWSSPGIQFAESCISAVKQAVAKFDYPAQEIFSGAGHDACNVSSVVPTSMIFIPCKDGLSHNVQEFANPEHVAAGANILMHAMLFAANVIEE